QMADIYAARTGLAHERLLEMMAAETWMTPEEAKANGFADVIKSGSQGATKARALASLNLSGLTVPREFHAAVERARTALAASPGSEPGTDRPSTSSELRASSPEQLAAQVADILDERRGRAPAPARAEREQQPPQSAGPTPPPAEPPPAVADRPITAEEGLQLLEELRASRKPSPEELASQVADILERRRQYR
ncbi:MAG: ATP-dependent Clp protease proteolytic subunit, partial [Sandaracinaceae bacterium]